MFIYHIIINIMLTVKWFANYNRIDTLALFLDRHLLSRNYLLGVNLGMYKLRGNRNDEIKWI